MDFHQNTQPEAQNEQNSTQGGQMTNQDTVSTTETISNQETASAQLQSNQNPPANNMPDGNAAPYQNQPPYGNDSRIPYQNQPSYGNDGRQAQQNQQSYGNNNGNLYQNGQPYDNSGRPPYQNGSPYSGNNQYQNNAPYGNGYPYYNRNTYQIPIAEPGSGLANASMILGIISIITSFTFTVYPAFILGSIAVVLALLSKGRRAKLLSKARTGMICAVIGLITNTVVVTVCTVLLFTNPDVRAEVNQTFEKQYGVSFDEMMKEIMEDNDFSY